MTKRLIPTSRRLHLGCGAKAPDGWVNIDGSWNSWIRRHRILSSVLVLLRLIDKIDTGAERPQNITIRNLRKPLPFADLSFDCVYASHLLEHLHPADGANLLKESYRVLSPGGIIRIAVPDLKFMVERYMSDKQTSDVRFVAAALRLQKGMQLRPNERTSAGLLRSLLNSIQDFHTHKWMYDEESLARILSDTGFINIRRCNYLESAIDTINEVEIERRVCIGNLCMEAERPL
jgi:predicted SAM-dependent methyltransferase